MKIECLPKDGRRGVFVIYIDDDLWREIHASIFGRKPSLPKTSTTLNEFAALFEQLEYRGAKQYALKRLTLKGQPSSELEMSLEERFVAPNTIKRVVEECRVLGYLNDQQWIESFIRCQLARKLGPQAIVMKLQAKGIAREVAKASVSQMADGEMQNQSIHQLLNTRYRSRDLTDYRTKQKVIASLIRKGYSIDVIRKALNVV